MDGAKYHVVMLVADGALSNALVKKYEAHCQLVSLVTPNSRFQNVPYHVTSTILSHESDSDRLSLS